MNKEPSTIQTHSTPELNLHITVAAQRMLEKRSRPLSVYLELLFSCMIRKRVIFPEVIPPDAIPIESSNQRIKLWFRAVGTKTCLVSEQPVPDLQTFPIQRIEPFIPKTLTLDHKAGQWRGEFGYKEIAP